MKSKRKNRFEPILCSCCAGSGEGQYDGTICHSCHGSGESENQHDNDYIDAIRDDYFEGLQQERRLNNE